MVASRRARAPDGRRRYLDTEPGGHANVSADGAAVAGAGVQGVVRGGGAHTVVLVRSSRYRSGSRTEMATRTKAAMRAATTRAVVR